MNIDTWDTTAINSPVARLTNLGAAISLALRDATRPHPCRLCLVFDAAYHDAVRRLLSTESVHSTFFTLTFGEPWHGAFTVDIEVPRTHVDILDELAAEAAAQPDQLTAAAL